MIIINSELCCSLVVIIKNCTLPFISDLHVKIERLLACHVMKHLLLMLLRVRIVMIHFFRILPVELRAHI